MIKITGSDVKSGADRTVHVADRNSLSFEKHSEESTRVKSFHYDLIVNLPIVTVLSRHKEGKDLE